MERIYSDDLARMTLHNMFMIMIKKGIKSANASGDGTGYSLTVTKHYRNEREKELKAMKRTERKKEKKRRLFACPFALVDIDTKMYIGVWNKHEF